MSTSDGTDEHIFTAFNYDGTHAQGLSMHGGFEEKYMYTYDTQGRLKKNAVSGRRKQRCCFETKCLQ